MPPRRATWRLMCCAYTVCPSTTASTLTDASNAHVPSLTFQRRAPVMPVVSLHLINQWREQMATMGATVHSLQEGSYDVLGNIEEGGFGTWHAMGFYQQRCTCAMVIIRLPMLILLYSDQSIARQCDVQKCWGTALWINHKYTYSFCIIPCLWILTKTLIINVSMMRWVNLFFLF